MNVNDRSERLRTASDAARLFRPLFADCSGERFALALLTESSEILRLAEIGGGGESHFDLPIRTIVSEAIRFDASRLLVAHCHPSGDPTPSAADIAATRRLARVAAEIDLVLSDHLIFGADRVCSLRGLGLL